METRAPYVLIGAFVLAAIVAVFGFVYWLHNTGGLNQRNQYQVRFDQPVSGLSTGSAVLFNGIRVGEVTGLRIDPQQPQGVTVSISVDAAVPMRRDTEVDMEYQGLTGVAGISLKGGAADAPAFTAEDGTPPMLKAKAGVGQGLTQAARETLRRIDDILDENAKPLKTAISGISTFADMLGRNSARIEEMLAGLEKMLGGGQPKEGPTVYDLAAPTEFSGLEKKPPTQIAVPDPTAILVFDSQKILIRTAEGTYSQIENAQWADNLPKLMQSRVVQSFANADMLRSVSKPLDDMNANFKLSLEIRNFEIKPGSTTTAVVEFAARLLGEDSKVVDARLFKATAEAKSAQAKDAVPALNDAFGKAAKDLVVWTVGLI
jgi:phospholipid/cholesterol/gamma-HCH transport system substrate-binding protein